MIAKNAKPNKNRTKKKTKKKQCENVDTTGAQNQNPLIGAHQLGQHVSPELTEALRFQEQRLEQALRLHGNDPRALGFALNNHQNQQHPAHNQ